MMNSPNEITTISYISNAVKLDEEEIEELMIHTKTTNNKNGIGGLLIYIDGTFFQIIEGSSNDIKNLFTKIKLDRRHCNILKIFEIKKANKKFERFNFSYIHNNNTNSSLSDLFSLIENNTSDYSTHETFIEKAHNLFST
ncbi:BLUF domain-containing protein [Aquimarina litoralis]|uniref:BLUF domain-containing protein n=1 Tax=Aquimarina litoralis TaxID=584605 RepID=UPI001C59449D|nr:BLUF domain-containing protein [Aquimarina litoralis]MBW1298821.1 hypothetical protein [Aquimarina litoralis]